MRKSAEIFLSLLIADWTNIEVDLIVADYLSMLNHELSDQDYIKTFHRNNLIKLLNNRSQSSIEFKHQNISAVLINLGLPFIKGYKPRYNYQHVLEERVLDYVSEQKTLLEPKFMQFADSIVDVSSNSDFTKVVDIAPVRQKIISEPIANYDRKPIKINYLQREQNNLDIGEKGEALVIEFEKWNLIQNGKASLVDKIEWISKIDDGAGFDILSKNLNGTDKYIEVKTTKLSKETPIFFSKNEYEFSRVKDKQFNLYRVFNFSKSPKMFFLNGNFDSFCNKEAIHFKGYF